MATLLEKLRVLIGEQLPMSFSDEELAGLFEGYAALQEMLQASRRETIATSVELAATFSLDQAAS